MSKHAMVQTIRLAAQSLGVPLEAPDGSERVSGHSLHVSGAQGLIRLGWHPWAVQLQGRWESDAVKRYIRDSPLDAARAVPNSAGPSLFLEQLVAAVVEKVGRTKPVPADLVPTCIGAAFPPTMPLAPLIGAERRIHEKEPAPSRRTLVINMDSGIYHRRLHTQAERAICGWSLGDSSAAAEVPDRTAGPTGWFQLCGRCWPSLRSAAKQAAYPAWLTLALAEAESLQ